MLSHYIGQLISLSFIKLVLYLMFMVAWPGGMHGAMQA